MINEVILEGIVVREPWKYTDDLFFRLGVYRDSDMPAKKLDAERDSGDYVNVRVSGGANGLIQIHRGMRLRVHGFIQSRDFKESLEEFLEKAHKQSNNEFQVEATGLKPNQVQIDRNAIEIVARRLIVMDNGNNTEKKPKPSLTAE
ncbi:hypothetical protein EG834_11875 [bacterium]|nr:hypothetical protein [bacterium]HML39387.1 hypothetical protein [Bellilinea sp.]HMN13804.1 hypothetical protein [Bellilinea sp.]